MKRILLAVATVLAMTAAQPTLAADAPVYKAPPSAVALFNWSGFYIGVQGGGAWATTRWSEPGPGGATTGDFTGSGWLIGGTVGANWQAPGSAIVLGVEGDLSWANVHAKTLISCVGEPGCNSTLSALGTLRGRIGLAANTWLLYLTAGGAWGHFDRLYIGAVPPGTGTHNQIGWTAGGGVEVRFAPQWSGKLEYLYTDFGTSDLFAVVIVQNFWRMHVVRAGLNWHF